MCIIRRLCGPEVLKDLAMLIHVRYTKVHNERCWSSASIEGKKITVAVYSFSDKTGQRKPSDTVLQLSQQLHKVQKFGLLQALQEVGNGSWFEVVERIGMDHLIKERLLIRNTRDVYEKELKSGSTSQVHVVCRTTIRGRNSWL